MLTLHTIDVIIVMWPNWAVYIRCNCWWNKTRRTCTFDPLGHESPHKAGTVFTPVWSSKSVDLQQRRRQWWRTLVMKRRRVSSRQFIPQKIPSSFLIDKKAWGFCHLKAGRGRGLSSNWQYWGELAAAVTQISGGFGIATLWGFDTSLESEGACCQGQFPMETAEGQHDCVGLGASALQQVTTVQPIREDCGSQNSPDSSAWSQ